MNAVSTARLTRWKRWSLLVLGTVLVLLFAEALCRFLDERGIVHTIEIAGSGSRIVPDEPLGFRLRPGDSDGVHVNALGFRGAEISKRKRAGCLRVVAIGGSTTFGNSVGDEETYPYVVEQILRAREPGRCVEVVNAGISGARSYHHLLKLRHDVLDLDPDVITFSVGWNDYGTYIWAMDDWDPTSLSTQTLVVDVSDHEMAALRNSAFYRVLYSLRKSMTFERNADRIASSERPTQALSAATAALRDNLVESVALCRARGIDVVLMEPPWVLGDDPEGDLRRLETMDLPGDMRRALVLARAFVEVPRLVSAVYGEVALTEGVSVADCAAPFRAMSLEERAALFEDPIHPRSEGYRVIAQCLASHLAERTR